MNNKKHYHLQQWYPSLPLGWKLTHRYEYDYKLELMENLSIPMSNSIFPRTIELPRIELDFIQYWKEHQKPLFVTEDGVEVFSDIDNLYAVNLTCFNKTKNTLRHSGWLIENSAYKVFYHESNADEYIWKNMRVFSYNDVISALILIMPREECDMMEELAKERIEQ